MLNASQGSTRQLHPDDDEWNDLVALVKRLKAADEPVLEKDDEQVLQDIMNNPKLKPDLLAYLAEKISDPRVQKVQALLQGAIDASASEDENSPNRLLTIANECTLFHTDDGEAYADIMVSGHRETYAIKSTGFKRWLRRRYFEDHKGAVSPTQLDSAIGTLEALANHKGSQERVFMRVGEQGGKMYVDLRDDAWRAVEIDAAGWRVVDMPPIRFKRQTNMLPLPVPEKGATLADLRPFLNFKTENGYILAISWVLAAFRSTQGYPILSLHGQHGVAKTTVLRVLRRLVDPSKSLERGPPKDDEAVFIYAENAHVMSFDNLSKIPDWLSDCFCRLATGGAHATRKLWTNREEASFEASRPIIFTGVHDTIKRGDLADRAARAELAAIPKTKRKTDREFEIWFTKEWPRLFGAVLDALVIGLVNLPELVMEENIRMADYGQWAVACEPAYAAPGAFMAAYKDSQEKMSSAVLEGEPIAPMIIELATEAPWNGTAGRLLKVLEVRLGDADKPQGWPSSPRQLADLLTRLAPNLLDAGVSIVTTWNKHDKQNTYLIDQVAREADEDNLRESSRVSPGSSAETPAQNLQSPPTNAGVAGVAGVVSLPLFQKGKEEAGDEDHGIVDYETAKREMAARRRALGDWRQLRAAKD